MKRCTLYITLSLLFVLLTHAATGQTASGAAPKIDDFYTDFPTTDQLFPDLIGGGDDVSRPSTIKDLVATVAPKFDRKGRLNPGLTVGANFYKIFGNDGLPAEDISWIHERWLSLLRNHEFAFSTSQDSNKVRAGIGLQINFIDEGDPVDNGELRTAIQGALRNAAVTASTQLYYTISHYQEMIRAAVAGNQSSNAKDLIIIDRLESTVWDGRSKPEHLTAESQAKRFRDSIEKIVSDPTKRQTILDRLNQSPLREQLHDLSVDYVFDLLEHQRATPKTITVQQIKDSLINAKWNARKLFGGIGMTAFSNDSLLKNFMSEHLVTGIGCAQPMLDVGQIILQYHYTKSLREGLDLAERSAIGGRILVGSAKQRLSVLLLWSSQIAHDSTGITYETTRRLKYTFGVEFKVADGSWLELAAGSDGTLDADNRGFVGKINWSYALQKQRRFDIE